MGQFFDELTPSLLDWIQRQHMFFVATAPLKADGHVNVSPKGIQGTFHVVNSKKVWYEDLWGSGNETISHAKENRRITLLFMAFKGAPKVARLFGTASVIEFGTPEYDELLPPATRLPGSRAIIVIDIYKVGTSCGFGVPLYEYKGQRSLLPQTAAKMESCDNDDLEGTWDESKPKFGMKKWWKNENAKSLDGLPGLTVALKFGDLFQNAGIPKISDEFPKSSIEVPSSATSVEPRGTAAQLPQTQFLDKKVIAAFLWGFLTAVIALHFVQ